MATITQRIEMAVSSYNTSGTANTYFEIRDAATRLDTTAFDGTVTFYFEAALKNTGTTGQTAYVQLWNNTDGVAVTGSELTSTVNDGYPQYLRSGSITLSGDKIYTIRSKHSTTTSSAVVTGARIVVIQSGSITKTQIHQELGSEQSASSTSNSNIPTTFAPFLYEAAKYDGTVTVRHDALVKTTASNTSTSGIWDVTAGSLVTGSEVTKTNDTNFTVLSSGNVTLTDGHVYKPTAYVSAGGSVTFGSNKLVFTITSFSKFLAYMLITAPGLFSPHANGTNIYPNTQAWIDTNPAFDGTNDFSGSTLTTYYESNIAINNAGQTAYADLEAYVHAVSATGISGSVVSHTGDTANTRVRSSSFTMPSGLNELCDGISASLGTNAATKYNSYLILEVSSVGSVQTLKTDQYTVAFSNPATIYTRTHTTDSLKRKATTTTHTTDANKRLSTIKIHTTSANKRLATVKIHSTDVNRRITGITRTHTTDSLKRKANTLSFTTSSNKRLAITRTHTTNSSIRGPAIRSYTTSANKKLANTRIYTTDSLKRSAVTRVHTTDSYRHSTFTRTHTTSSNKRSAFTKFHSTDSNKKISGLTRTHTTNANKRNAYTLSFVTDTNRYKSFTRIFSTDSLKRLSITKFFTTSSNKRAPTTRTHTSNSVIRKFNTRVHTTDSVRRTALTRFFTTNSNRRLAITRTHFADASKTIIPQKSHTTDALKHIQVTRTYTTSSSRRGPAVKFHTTDTSTTYVGAIFWVSPADLAVNVLSTTPLVFIMPITSANMHFEMQIDTVNTFSSIALQDLKSWLDQTGWEYYNGTVWVPIPSIGVDPIYSGNQVRYTPNLTSGTYYRRVRGRVVI